MTRRPAAPATLGCGGSDSSFSLGSPTGGPQAAPVTRVTVTPKDDAPVTQRIGRQGGTVALTTADGTRYQLAIPPLALLGDTDITLAAVVLQGLPVSGRLLGAVRMG